MFMLLHFLLYYEKHGPLLSWAFNKSCSSYTLGIGAAAGSETWSWRNAASWSWKYWMTFSCNPSEMRTGTNHAQRPAPPWTYSLKQVSYVYASAAASSPRSRRSVQSWVWYARTHSSSLFRLNSGATWDTKNWPSSWAPFPTPTYNVYYVLMVCIYGCMCMHAPIIHYINTKILSTCVIKIGWGRESESVSESPVPMHTCSKSMRNCFLDMRWYMKLCGWASPCTSV